MTLHLHWAFQNGDYSLSTKLLVNLGSNNHGKAKLKSLTVYGDTLLHLACRHGWLDIVRYLIEDCDCSPNIRDRKKQAPLHIACRYGHINLVHYLISDRNCDVTTTTVDHWTVLHYACRYDHINIVKYLATVQDLVQSVDKSSVLHLACKYGHGNVLTYLINEVGFSADDTVSGLLLIACQQDQVTIVRHLLKNISNYQRLQLELCKELFLFCCKYGLLDILKQLTFEVCEVAHTTDKSEMSGVHYGCQKGHLPVVKHLVEECSCDINARDLKGLTPLHLACKYGHNADIVKYMLSRPECDALARTYDGSTILHFSCATNEYNPQVMNILIEHGASMSKALLTSVQTYVDCSNFKADEPTTKAAIVSFIIEVAKFDPSVRNYAGISPIQALVYPFIVRGTLACHSQVDFYRWISCDNEYRSVYEIKRHVSTQKLDLSETASNGDTALHMACVANKIHIVKYLLCEYGFDPNVKNRAGDTPLRLALKVHVYRMLLKDKLSSMISLFVNNDDWNPAISEKDSDGNNLLHLACQANQKELIRALEKRVSLMRAQSLVYTANNDGFKPLELISNPKLIVDYMVKHAPIFTFKPGSLSQFIWFCKNIDTRRLESILIYSPNKMKWEHSKTSDCCVAHHMLHLSNHPVWLLIKVCFHSHATETQRQEIQSEALSTENFDHIFVVEIVDKLIDSSFKGVESNEDLLYAACRTNRYHIVKHLISAHNMCKPNRSFDGQKAFEMTNSSKIMQLLVQHGLNIQPGYIDKLFTVTSHKEVIKLDTFKILNETEQWYPDQVCNSNGDTALHLSIRHHKYELMSYLLSEVKCDPNIRNVNDETPFQLMITTSAWSDSECIDMIKVIMSSKQWVPNLSCDSKGDTALHLTVRNHRHEVVHFLLFEAKCDPYVGNTRYETPIQLLMSSLKWSDSECINIIKALQTNEQWSPYSRCTSKGDTILHLLARNHRPRVMNYLLSEEKCDPSSVKNLDEETSIQLLMSLYYGWSDSECVHIIRVLIENYQWNPNSSCTSQDDTIFHLSVHYHRYKVVHFLVSEVMCDPSVRNLNDATPIHVLMKVRYGWSDSECINIINALISTKHWDPNSSCNSKGDTVLHLSALNHRYQVVYYLLSESTCDPSIGNGNGDTIIQFLVSTLKLSDFECINLFKALLSSKRWDPSASCNSKGDTALHLSALHHRNEVLHFLLSEVKCDPNVKNLTGKTPVQLLMSEHNWSDSEFINLIKALMSTKQWNHNSSCNINGDTALHLSVLHNGYEAVHYMLSTAKCDPKVRNGNGDTPIQLLMSAYEWSDSDIINALKSIKQWDPNSSCNSKDDTALHLSVRCHRSEIALYLLSETNCDPNITNIDLETPLKLAYDTNSTIFNHLIRYGANPDNVYKSLGKSVGLIKPLIPPVKVFIVGNSGVGKSTLIEALKIETSILVRPFIQRKRVLGDEKTAGIVPHNFESKQYGQVIFYDFAGHREFYNSHVAILQNIIKRSSPIFLIVVKLSKSEEEVQQSIHYWLSFLSNNCSSAIHKPHVIIIGSHADIIHNRKEDPQQKAADMSNYVQMACQISSFEYVGMYPMDCRYSESPSIDDLRICLKNSCKSLRIADVISFNAHCCHAFLSNEFEMSVAVTIEEVHAEMEKAKYDARKGVVKYLPDSIKVLTLVCDELNDRGHILFFKNNDNIESSWVILDKICLLSKVTGTIFAPNDFKQHCQIAESTGVVPLSRLLEKFPDFVNKSEVLIGFLSHLEFCREIRDIELRELISKHQECLNAVRTHESENERYFLFPGLITLNAPSDLWRQTHHFKYHCGWSIKCTRQDQFFSSRFTQVLLLRLAFSFTLIKKKIHESVPALQRECSIWKNGIFWGETFGMEIIVEIHSNMVVLLTRCQEDNLLPCISLRSNILKKILQCTHDICSNIEIIESFIDPSEATEFPLAQSVLSKIPQFSLQMIAEAIVTSKKYESLSVVSPTRTISLNNLLTFEPYAEVGTAALKKVCKSRSDCEETVADNFLGFLSHGLAKKALQLFIEIFKTDSASTPYPSATSEDLFTQLKTWRDECKGTYGCLKQRLDQYSIYAGRNVLVRYAQLCSHVCNLYRQIQ